MNDLNRFCCTGHVTRDPELSRLPGGSPVMNFPIAVSEAWTSATTGVREDRTCFLPVAVYGPYAETLAGIIRKGSLVYVDGTLRTNSWERDGRRMSRIQVVASRVQAIGPRPASRVADGRDEG